jgi:hypothetical protein
VYGFQRKLLYVLVAVQTDLFSIVSVCAKFFLCWLHLAIYLFDLLNEFLVFFKIECILFSSLCFKVLSSSLCIFLCLKIHLF